MLETSTVARETRVGANRLPNGSWEFLMWAPHTRRASIHLQGNGEVLPLEALDGGYHSVVATGLEPASQYFLPT